MCRSSPKVVLALTACLLSRVAWAQTIDVNSVAGVYKSVWHGCSDDECKERYRSENILEIVKHSRSSVYFRTELTFASGHACHLWGIADVEGDALVYHGGANSEHKQCVLRLHISADQIALEDHDYACQVDSCSATGGYSGASFELTTRRTIRYTPRILASKEYAEAVAEYERRPQRRAQ